MVLLIDTNIILDVFLNRADFIEHSRKIFSLCETGKVQGVLAVSSLTNIWFVLRKEYSDKESRQLVLSLFDAFEVVAPDRTKLISALERKKFADFECCLQDECAQEIRADYIVTRNKTGFQWSKVKALLPEELLELV